MAQSASCAARGEGGGKERIARSGRFLRERLGGARLAGARDWLGRAIGWERLRKTGNDWE